MLFRPTGRDCPAGVRGRFQPCSKLIQCCSGGASVSVSWGNWSPPLGPGAWLWAPSEALPELRGAAALTRGGWCIPDSVPPSGVPGGRAAGFPRPVRVGGRAPSLEVSPLSVSGGVRGLPMLVLRRMRNPEPHATQGCGCQGHRTKSSHGDGIRMA